MVRWSLMVKVAWQWNFKLVTEFAKLKFRCKTTPSKKCCVFWHSVVIEKACHCGKPFFI